MKRIILFMFIFITVSISNVNALTPTLQEITEKFNNQSIIKEYYQAGAIWNAKTNNNILTITTSANGEEMIINYILKNNILTIQNDKNGEILSKVAVSAVLIDTIGQFHGYHEGDLYSTLNSEQIMNYTLENEGLKIILNENDAIIQIDISKKIPLIDFFKTYITTEDLKIFTNTIQGDGGCFGSIGDLYFNKGGTGSESTIIIAEKNSLTDKSYNSLLSFIEATFDSKNAVDYFKSIYPSLSTDKIFEGFKIEIQPTKTEFEKLMPINDYDNNFIRITINKDAAKDAIEKYLTKNPTSNSTTDITNDTKKDDNLISNPQTGIYNSIFKTIILGFIAIISLKIIKKKNYFHQI